MKRLVLLLALAVAACSQAHVTTTESADTVRLPAPAHIVVTEFTLTPGRVHLDSGVGARVERMADGASVSAAQAKAAQDTRAALAETLAARLASYGLPVERLPADATVPQGSLLVQGQIVAVNEGNRTRRILVGLGAGRSSIRADTQLYYVTDPRAPHLLRAFTETADSGRMPGAVETMGVGAAAGGIATSAAVTGATHAGAEVRRTGDEALADKLAQALARQIGAYAASQGWIPASVVH